MVAVRMRRIASRWPWSRRYEIELRDRDGQTVEATRTSSPTAFLIKKAGVHSTDSWDWVRAADQQFERGSENWVTGPYTD